MNSGTNLGDLAKRANSGTNLGDLAKRVNSGPNLGDLAERANSGTNLGDLAGRANSGTNLGDLAERANSGTNLRYFAERADSGTNLGDVAERAKSSTNLGDLAESRTRAQILEIWPRGRTRAQILEIWPRRERYNIPTEYGLQVPQPRQRPYSLDAPRVCISVDALEAGLWFPLHPTIEECIRWWKISPSQVAPNSWRYLVVFLGECRGAGIIPTRNLFMACFRLYKSQGGYYLTACVGFKVSRAPSNNKGCRPDGSRQSAWDAKGVWRETPFGSCSSAGSGGQRPPTTEALKSSSKRPTEASTQQADDLALRHKKVKILSRRHKSRHDEGGSRSHSKGKEPTAPVEGLEMPVESAEEAALPVFHHPRSMKDLYGMKVQKDDARYYALYMSDLAHQDPNKEMQVRWEKLKNSTKIWNDLSAAEEFERGLMHP
ncbi:hypothetical protein BHE74_00059516 [Ensete ventricosum]|nr:hypothetical protein BHE74_00059516 [Ensete ventricosum]